MYTFAREDKSVIFQNLDSIREALIHLMTEDGAFIDSIELSTSAVQAVTSRFDTWRLALHEIVGISKREPRCFSRQLKEALFNSNSTCRICEQKIEEVDDAAVDHIKQYWTGGRTIPENARLTHRYCNWARLRELRRIFGDGVNQAADLVSGATSIPSRNLTPLMTFGN
jgi:HNH endonuclease